MNTPPAPVYMVMVAFASWEDAQATGRILLNETALVGKVVTADAHVLDKYNEAGYILPRR